MKRFIALGVAVLFLAGCANFKALETSLNNIDKVYNGSSDNTYELLGSIMEIVDKDNMFSDVVREDVQDANIFGRLVVRDRSCCSYEGHIDVEVVRFDDVDKDYLINIFEDIYTGYGDESVAIYLLDDGRTILMLTGEIGSYKGLFETAMDDSGIGFELVYGKGLE